MSQHDFTRRGFLAGAAAALSPSQARSAKSAPSRRSILNFNNGMEYRRLGKTGLMVSAVCLGGHWKRVATMISPGFKGEGYLPADTQNLENPAFLRNRDEVISRAMELGVNYVDACSPQEILAYSKVLKGRRNRMYFGFSWHTREPRFKEWRTAQKLVQGLEAGLKEAGLDYVDVWRISLPMDALADLAELQRVEEATIEGLAMAKKQGKARFTGVSSHNRPWLKSLIEQNPKQIEVVLFPYTASSRELPSDSIFGAIRKHNVGVFGIKPFANNSLFKGDSSLNSPHKDEDDQRARLALRYILGNDAITAPIPGLINVHQVENAAKAVAERRKLDAKERARLDRACTEMWASLRPGYEWLKNWEQV
ncbi:MAG: aldo/keto reductase [Bryobacteraceae bacterium]